MGLGDGKGQAFFHISSHTSFTKVRWGTKSTLAIRLELVSRADIEQVWSSLILKILRIEINEARHLLRLQAC